MNLFSIDLNTTPCSQTHETLQSLMEKGDKNQPYLFLSNSERVVWYDAKTFKSEEVKKIHLFACFQSGVFFLGECESSHLSPLYLNPTQDSFWKEPNDELLMDALMFHHKGANENYQTCKKNFKIIEEGGKEQRAWLILGKALLKSGVMAEQNKGVDYLLASSGSGDLKGCLIAGKWLLNRTDEKLKERGAALLDKIDSAFFDLDLGLQLAKYYASKKSQKAINLFYQFAKKGDPTACFEYAELLPEGEMSKGRYAWYERAALAEKPHPLAAYNAAKILEKWDDPQYDKKRRAFYIAAAANHNTEAAFKAALMCQKGIGGEKNLEWAKNLLIESASEIGAEAYFQLGLVNIELGLMSAAYVELTQAKNLGHEKAASELELLLKKEETTDQALRRESASRSTSDSLSSSLRKKSTSDSAGKDLLTIPRSSSSGSSRRGSFNELPQQRSPSPSSFRKKSLIDYSRESLQSLTQSSSSDDEK